MRNVCIIVLAFCQNSQLFCGLKDCFQLYERFTWINELSSEHELNEEDGSSFQTSFFSEEPDLYTNTALYGFKVESGFHVARIDLSARAEGL